MNNSLKTTKEIKVLLSQLRAFCNTINEILNNSSSSENGRYACYKDMASIYNDFAKRVEEVTNVSSMFYTFNIEDVLNHLREIKELTRGSADYTFSGINGVQAGELDKTICISIFNIIKEATERANVQQLRRFFAWYEAANRSFLKEV